MRGKTKYVYGPVPSRRLGFSLGIDIVPYKICNLNCVYCQLGPTPGLKVLRRPFQSTPEILREIAEALKRASPIDFITFSGSGEPTLNSQIGLMIRGIKKITGIPVAVLTNATLLFRRSVRADLGFADVVMPSLDAVSSGIFKRLNRPHPSLDIEAIIDGLVNFRNEFEGQIWLEVLIVRGLNDNDSEIAALEQSIKRIRPNEVHLNTVVRPPAVSSVKPVSMSRLREIQRRLGDICKIVAEFDSVIEAHGTDPDEQRIVALVSRHPATPAEVAIALNIHPNALVKHLKRLVADGRIRATSHEGKTFYRH